MTYYPTTKNYLILLEKTVLFLMETFKICVIFQNESIFVS